MKLVNDVFKISESFMNNSQYVQMNEKYVKKMSTLMIEAGPPKFSLPDIKDKFKGVLLELVAASVNYCYWYGKHSIRPGGASSTVMYDLMMQSFFDFYPSQQKFETCLDKFGRALSIHRFPLLEDRIRHLNQLKKYSLDFCCDIVNLENDIKYSKDLTYFFTTIVESFPGFASDIFLKRASLFFIQLYRRFGWFKDELRDLHVPADYQIPKMLEHFNCIEYNHDLYIDIISSKLIPKNSVQECEIRAATILTMKKLCELTGWNVADIDSFLFLKKNEVTGPFHLCITTDY